MLNDLLVEMTFRHGQYVLLVLVSQVALFEQYESLHGLQRCIKSNFLNGNIQPVDKRLSALVRPLGGSVDCLVKKLEGVELCTFLPRC